MSGPGDRASKQFSSQPPTRYGPAEGRSASEQRERADARLSGSKSSARSEMLLRREPGDLGGAPLACGCAGTPRREGRSLKPSMNAAQESDSCVVARKPSNTRVTPVEEVERRQGPNEKICSAKRSPDPEPEDTSAHAPERIGRKAKEAKKERFNNLYSQLKKALLRRAYHQLRPDAAVGVDGETWATYGENLETRLQSLEDRLQRGGYHPPPVRRVYIPKADGQRRPLGIPALEDKIVQQAARWLLEPIYEVSEFLGFSYGYRPRRGPHRALDALAEAIARRVSVILEADITRFFETLDHGWLVRFVEHRIGDSRMVKLIRKWLKAGVMEDGVWQPTEQGTPQGGIVSPLLANIYLHHVLDQWVHQWRRRYAQGTVYLVRYCDDFVMGFEQADDAQQMRRALEARLQDFGLELHPDKTRVLRFGRSASRDCQREGRSRPETFDFLGFTHICAKDRRGRFALRRRTSRKKRAAKLSHLREQLRKHRHAPPTEQQQWLSQVLRGHYAYYGVPGNYRAMASFYNTLEQYWHRVLQRRSQTARWTAAQRERFKQRHSLPRPRIVHPWPDQRFRLTVDSKGGARCGKSARRDLRGG
jgi:RNA-directed DNA polymerase